MLLPRKVKYRKQQRGVMKGRSFRGFEIAFGQYALKSLGTAWITSRQIEASRRAMTRHIKRGGKIWIRIFPDHSVSKIPAETGMGGGKGNLDHFVAQVQPGRILFEMDGVPEELAKVAMQLAASKLPIKTKFINKELE